MRESSVILTQPPELEGPGRWQTGWPGYFPTFKDGATHREGQPLTVTATVPNGAGAHLATAAKASEKHNGAAAETPRARR